MARLRVCAEPGCPVMDEQNRCPTHRRERDARRGSAEHRGYGLAHRRERRRIEQAGIQNFRCGRCGAQFEDTEPFQLGHTDDRRAWSGPEHLRCNLGAAGRASHRVHEHPEPTSARRP